MKIIYNDGTVAECPKEEELHVLRHTAAHIMAQAIKRLYPEADFGYGPATENGFYYDVDLGDTKLTDEDLANIEKEMRKITKENLPIKAFILPRRAHRRPARGCGHQLLPAGRVYRHVRRPPPDLHQGPEGLQDHPAVRRLLEGRQGQQDADPHQRRGVPHPGRAGRVGKAAGRGPRPRPPQDRPRDAAVHDRRPGGPRPAHVPAQRLCGLAGAGKLYQGQGARPRLPARHDCAP